MKISQKGLYVLQAMMMLARRYAALTLGASGWQTFPGDHAQC
jgi:hypothetical protein